MTLRFERREDGVRGGGNVTSLSAERRGGVPSRSGFGAAVALVEADDAVVETAGTLQEESGIAFKDAFAESVSSDGAPDAFLDAA